ncbi:hypothetical protein [Tropicibacter sp. S64]|uniref:hypothetical protein n=1 Tax=Tropicibacter sp. S64 TaxID=3415122 RepID=UPI003C7CA37A
MHVPERKSGTKGIKTDWRRKTSSPELGTIHAKSQDLADLFHARCNVQSGFAEIEKAPAYAHSEIANTPRLAAAANTLKGWTGLAEYSMARRNASKEGRDLLGAYLATRSAGYLFEFKMAWMKDGKSQLVHYSGDPVFQAKDQIAALDHPDGDAQNHGYSSFFGTFLVPSLDKDSARKRKDVFNDLCELCKDKGFYAYAVFSPALPRKALLRGPNREFRPAIAIDVTKYRSNNQ